MHFCRDPAQPSKSPPSLASNLENHRHAVPFSKLLYRARRPIKHALDRPVLLLMDPTRLPPVTGNRHTGSARRSVDRTTSGWFNRLYEQFTAWKHTWDKGWHTSVLVWLALTRLIFLINFGFTTGAIAKKGIGNGTQEFYAGSCQHLKNASLWIYLAINILGTGLLAASNYTMQVVYAPTRKDIDRRLRKKKWLDVGAHGLRNLSEMGQMRVIIWLCLAVQSPCTYCKSSTGSLSRLRGLDSLIGTTLLSSPP